MKPAVEPLLQSSTASTFETLSQEPHPSPESLREARSTLVIEESQIQPDQPVSSACVTGQEESCPFWRVFSSTFFTIFLAEIGDKTQVSTLLMSAEFHKPWVVFLGAGTALVATTLIGVGVGQWLSSRLSPRTLDIAAGIMLALISASLLWDVVQL
ncbi:MAG: TMEM165/GDT1 family protein [Leptolyngbyaceae cyanobacterium bins.302]|nr:TMEM165/GDT1 family protein [Leptolyngbyaceae cyanobacterium bins.302]